jgi:hypothetical protein
MKQLKDYLHYYLGQEAEGFWTEEDGSGRISEGIGPIVRIASETLPGREGPVVIRLPIRKNSPNETDRYFDFNQVMPLLRPLTEIPETEGEALFGVDRYWDIVCGEGDCERFTAEEFKYLLSSGFDVFGLIEEGVAIDKTKQHQGGEKA